MIIQEQTRKRKRELNHHYATAEIASSRPAGAPRNDRNFPQGAVRFSPRQKD